MSPAARPLRVAAPERRSLRILYRRSSVRRRVRIRARIVLAAALGLPNCRIAELLGISRPTVLLWRKRYLEGGMVALLHDAPRPGRPSLRARAARSRRFAAR
jgi:transposase